MKDGLGPSFKLVREENELTQTYVSKKLGISRTALDRFESTSTGVSKEIIIQMGDILHIDLNISQKEIETIDQYFLEVFEDLFYLNRNYMNVFNSLNNMQHKIVATKYYPLLYIFNYCITIQNNSSYRSIIKTNVQTKLNELENMIDRIVKNIPASWVTLYYDYRGERFRYQCEREESMLYYEKAEKISDDERHLALIYYRKALALVQLNKNVKALHEIEKAKNIFDKYLNFERSLSSEYLKAMAYDNMRDYDMALQTYERCLKAIKNGTFKLSEEAILNNILWLLVMKQDYDKVISYAKKTKEFPALKKTVDLYLAWVYFCKNDIEQSKIKLSDCENNNDLFKDPSYNNYFDILKNIIFDNEGHVQEIINNKDQIFVYSCDTWLFIYQMLIKHYKNKNNRELTELYTKLYYMEYAKINS